MPPCLPPSALRPFLDCRLPVVATLAGVLLSLWALLGGNRQVDAGADFVITQFFYDTKEFLSYVKRCRAVGITCPIIPGIMAIQVCCALHQSVCFGTKHVPGDGACLYMHALA